MASADFSPIFPSCCHAGSPVRADDVRDLPGSDATLSRGPRRIYPHACPDDHWASPSTAGLPHHAGLVSDSCSSNPRFASGFLQIPPRDGHPCPRLVVPVITAHRGLARPRVAQCLAHRHRGGMGFAHPAPQTLFPPPPYLRTGRKHVLFTEALETPVRAALTVQGASLSSGETGTVRVVYRSAGRTTAAIR